MLLDVLGLLAEPWALLMLGASLAYALGGYVDEYLLRHTLSTDTENEDSIGVLTIFSGVFGGIVAIVAAQASLVLPETRIMMDAPYIQQSLIVGALEIAWLVPYFYATKRGGAMQTTPLFQLVPLWACGLGVIFFAEVPTLPQIIGAVAIVIGALVLNASHDILRVDRVTIVLMVIATATIALIYFLFKQSAIESDFVGSVFWSGIGMCGSSIVVWACVPSYRRQFNAFVVSGNRRYWCTQCANETLETSAIVATHTAAAWGPSVMAVSALSGYQPLFVLILGWLVSRQRSVLHRVSFKGYRAALKTVAIGYIALGTVCIAQESPLAPLLRGSIIDWIELGQ